LTVAILAALTSKNNPWEIVYQFIEPSRLRQWKL
jgi:hypothetical protein